MILHSAHDDHWVHLSAGVIAATGRGSSWRRLVPSGAADPAVGVDVVDARGHRLAPALVDIHCHGAARHSFDAPPRTEDPDAASRAVTVHHEHGTGTLIASLVSAPVPDFEAAIHRLVQLQRREPALAGIHLEGPFLSPTHCGAHDPRHLLEPSLEVLDRLLSAGDGLIRQVTLAPELPGALRLIRQLTARGVRAAVGHTAANYAQARAAFDAGASILTHAFNAMPGLHHREPGPVAAAVDSAHVTLEVIADGVHVHPSVVRLLFGLAPKRICLVTDAMSATGCPPGRYRLGDLDVDVSEGSARLAGTSTLAGSTLTLGEAVARTVASGVGLEDALRAATTTPARALGLTRAGTLEPGAPLPVLVDDRGRLLSLPPSRSARG